MSSGFKHFTDPFGIGIDFGHGLLQGNTKDPTGLLFGKDNSRGGSSVASSIASAPVPVPAPPVSAAAAEVIQAEHDIAQQNLLKKSVKKTIMAGDTGGFNPAGMNPANAPGASGSYRKK